MSALEEALNKIKQTGSIGLLDLKALKLKDLEKLEGEINYWCLYGNGNLEKLGKRYKEH